MVVIAVALARYIQSSWIGRGLRAIRDDEMAAECSGVPTLQAQARWPARISGALMCAAGAPFAMYLSVRRSRVRLQPELLGLGARHAADRRHRALDRTGPRRHAARRRRSSSLTVTISSEVNVLVLGVMLVLFVVAAPEGILGLCRRRPRAHRREGQP